MPKRKTLPKPKPSEEDWRALGYSVTGPPGARIVRPAIAPTDPPTEPSNPLARARERLRRWKKLHNYLVHHLRNFGPLPPGEYARFFTKHRLGGLYLDVVNLPERRIPHLLRLCVNCLRPMRVSKREYCSERCRQAAKVRRWRDQHPKHKLKRK